MCTFKNKLDQLWHFYFKHLTEVHNQGPNLKGSPLERLQTCPDNYGGARINISRENMAIAKAQFISCYTKYHKSILPFNKASCVTSCTAPDCVHLASLQIKHMQFNTVTFNAFPTAS